MEAANNTDEKRGDEKMRHKRIFIAFLLILGLLLFSGCANNDDGVLDNNPPQNSGNGTTVPDDITDNNGFNGNGMDGNRNEVQWQFNG